MKLVYPAIFTPCLEREGYTVVVPDLPGCVSEGDSLANSVEMGIDAASGWILGEIEDGKQFPAPTPVKEIVADDPESFVSLLVLDMDSYAEKYGSQSVRKNVTIPAYLNTYAEQNNISVSGVLQDGLLSLAQNKR